MDSDDEDYEDDDASEDAEIIWTPSVYTFSYGYTLESQNELRVVLTSGFRNSPVTPPDFVV